MTAPEPAVDTAAEQEPRCICDGAAYYSTEENKARHPFLVNADCPFHGKGGNR